LRGSHPCPLSTLLEGHTPLLKPVKGCSLSHHAARRVPCANQRALCKPACPVQTSMPCANQRAPCKPACPVQTSVPCANQLHPNFGPAAFAVKAPAPTFWCAPPLMTTPTFDTKAQRLLHVGQQTTQSTPRLRHSPHHMCGAAAAFAAAQPSSHVWRRCSFCCSTALITCVALLQLLLRHSPHHMCGTAWHRCSFCVARPCSLNACGSSPKSSSSPLPSLCQC